ncbi:MAG: DUF6298 domain-containing protein [Armatimonadota bacterium]|jgi:hypothetical protein
MLLLGADAASGPLRVCADNPRYFTDGSGRAIYLTGSHTWANRQERAYPETPEFDYDAWLDFMARHQHNFMRLWAWEHAAWMQFTDRKIVYRPNRYERTGPGKALDGGPKFDVTRLNEGYFQRLRERVAAARERGIYVAVMLFEGFSIEQKGTVGVDPKKGNQWDGHPLNRANNINGIDGDPNGNGEGEETHTLAMPEITRLQEAYVRRVIDTVNDLDNVLYEISNESHGESTEWQYHMIDLIHDYEATKPRQHPAGMTFQYGRERRGSNDDLFASPAEWVSPNPPADGGRSYRNDPPPADGSKVVITDTDHLWGIGGNRAWAWKSFCRGLNPIFMDPYLDARTGHKLDPQWDPIRRAMGHTRMLADRMDLTAMAPHGRLASSAYCLANPGSEYVVYLPDGGSVTVDLSAGTGRLAVEWIDPGMGSVHPGDPVTGGAPRELTAPFEGDAVLYIRAR